MKKTFNVDDKLLKEAKAAGGTATDTETIRLGLEALVRHAAYQRLRALRGSEPFARDVPRRPPYAAELDRLLGLDEVAGHELVYGELLIGDRGGRVKFLAAYERMHQADTVPHGEVVDFVRDRDLHGRGMGWIDVHLLASAIVGRFELWTADQRFFAVANDVGVAYEPL
jgi:hypothetical protein